VSLTTGGGGGGRGAPVWGKEKCLKEVVRLRGKEGGSSGGVVSKYHGVQMVLKKKIKPQTTPRVSPK